MSIALIPVGQLTTHMLTPDEYRKIAFHDKPAEPQQFNIGDLVYSIDLQDAPEDCVFVVVGILADRAYIYTITMVGRDGKRKSFTVTGKSLRHFIEIVHDNIEAGQ